MKMRSIVDSYITKRRGIGEVVEFDRGFYACLRVTGFGTVERNFEGLSKKVERVKSAYLKDDFAYHCSRLPICVGHPKSGVIDKESLKANPIVGHTLEAFYEEDEVWAVCIIYVKELLRFFESKNFSTSPGFFVEVTSVNEDSMKESPTELNHLALVGRGRWDSTLEGKESKGVKD